MPKDRRFLPMTGRPLLRRLLLSEVLGPPRGAQGWRPKGAPPLPAPVRALPTTPPQPATDDEEEG